jgi:DNA polymerase III subunit delta'
VNSAARRFGNLLGQPRACEALSRALDEDRLSPAVLFHGPAGVGKLTAAMELARHLLCPVGKGLACGQCDACRRISAIALLHPDLSLLYPQTKEDAGERGGTDASPAAPDLHALQEDVRRNPAWRILATPTRERLKQLFLSPNAGVRHLLLVVAAERLNEESGNALLKVLEEPPARAVLVLLCENPSALLPTLRSRCQPFRFGTLSRRDVASFLAGEPGLDPIQASLLASLSGGRIGRALSLVQQAEGYRLRRGHLAELFGEARRLKTAAAALSAARDFQSDDSEILEDLSILSDLLRDAMLREAGCPPALLTVPSSSELQDPPRIAPEEAAFLLVRVERAREDIRRYVNRQIAVESLFLDLVNPPPAPFGAVE